MILGLLLWLSQAWATDLPTLQARLAEIESYRALRLRSDGPTVTEGELRKVAAGQTVTALMDAGAGSRAYGVALVNLPIGVFWAALNDETRHPGYTKVAYSELLSGRVCGSGRHILQYLPVPYLADRWWIGILTANDRIQQASSGAVRELSFSSSTDPSEVTSAAGKKMIAKAEPIGYSRGAWFMVAVSDRVTYVEYHLHTDPGGHIPSSMASMFAAKGVRENIAAITRFAKEAKPSCPIQ